MKLIRDLKLFENDQENKIKFDTLNEQDTDLNY